MIKFTLFRQMIDWDAVAEHMKSALEEKIHNEYEIIRDHPDFYYLKNISSNELEPVTAGYIKTECLVPFFTKEHLD